MWIILAFLFLIKNASSAVTYNDISNDTVNDVQVDYVLLDNNNPCLRKCEKNQPPMLCRYTFEVEWYETLSKACFDCPMNVSDCSRPDCIPGDGRKRAVLVVNRQMPGPAIEVCQGDEIIVDVENRLASESTSIHWHGQHQKNSPYMDGVPYVTQCPIQPGSIFRYTFEAANPGTHFWHSHIGFQRADGMFGPLIVRQAEEDDPQSNLYDYDMSDHVITILDWDEQIGLQKFTSHHHSYANNKPSSLLVNGLGRFHRFERDNVTHTTPTSRFNVEQGYRYRFRIINAGFLNCPIEFSIDNHTLHIISTDGFDFVSVEATSFVTYAGERFDFIVHADQPKSLYWMRFRGLMDCDERFTRAHQMAVLEYKDINATIYDYPDGDPSYEDAHREGLQINGLNKGTEHNISHSISMPHLEALAKPDISLKLEPDFQYYVAYDFYKLDNPHFYKAGQYGFYNVNATNKQILTPQINHISMKMPSHPLLPQRNQIKEDMFCNKSTVNNCDKKYCECTHVIQIPLNAVAELILIDEGVAYDANHPLHLHGHAFRVVAMERLGDNTTVEEVKERDRKGLIKRNLLNAPLKDTVTVPDGGYTIVRFVANNPGKQGTTCRLLRGYWLFHCHIEFHVEIGMALVVKVGNDEDMLPVPKNFPTCGNYMPEPVVDKCETKQLLTKIENLFPMIFNKKCDNISSSATKLRYISFSTIFHALGLIILHLFKII